MEAPKDLNDPVNAAWLVQRHALQLVMPLAVASRIGGRRSTHAGRPATVETYVESMRPAQTLRGHLTFHLKHEAPHFELLSRLFASCDAGEIAAWVADGVVPKSVERCRMTAPHS